MSTKAIHSIVLKQWHVQEGKPCKVHIGVKGRISGWKQAQSQQYNQVAFQ